MSTRHLNVPSVWNETFSFKGQLRKLLSEPLKLHLWDYDTFSRDDYLGHCAVELGETDEPGGQHFGPEHIGLMRMGGVAEVGAGAHLGLEQHGTHRRVCDPDAPHQNGRCERYEPVPLWPQSSCPG